MNRKTRFASQLAIVAAALCLATLLPASDNTKTPPPPKGQRVFTCGHSFHVWVVRILDEMAKVAGIDHEVAGVSSIGGSRVIQHWDVAEEKNKAKEALRAGKVDVLTLSPIWVVPPKDLKAVKPVPGDKREITWLPDEGIEKFAKLALEHNPNVRITVQEYWLPNDEYVPVYPLQTRKRFSHDDTDLAELRKCQVRYDHDVDEFVRAINKRLGKDVIMTVPAGMATVALREKIVAGKVPGLAKQSELFRDSWGHPTAPVQALATYCHFAIIYRRSPVGLPLPSILAKNPAWDDKLNRLLQELAWDAVCKHSMSGVRAKGGQPAK